MADHPVLIGCGRGTTSQQGRQAMGELFDAVRLALPGVEVREAYIEGPGPELEDVLAEIPQAHSGTSAVVVPFLLGGGSDIYHDISRAVEGRDDVVSTMALGPDRRLIDVVLERLREAHVNHDATLVLAATGSADPRSKADTEAAAETLRGVWAGPVRVGYASGQEPSVTHAVAAARQFGEEGVVAVAAFILAPGVVHTALQDAGADMVTGPLAPHPDIVSIVIDRYGALIHP